MDPKTEKETTFFFAKHLVTMATGKLSFKASTYVLKKVFCKMYT